MKKPLSSLFSDGRTVRGVSRVILATSFGVLLIATMNNAYAQTGGTGISSILQFQNVEPSEAAISAGQIVTLKGLVANLVAEDMIVSVSLESNGVQGEDWIVVSRMPSEGSIDLSAGESIPYEFNVRFVNGGSYQILPYAVIEEFRGSSIPIDSNSPECPGCEARATLVTVSGQDAVDSISDITVGLIAAAIVIAGGAAYAIYYTYRRKTPLKR